MSVFLAADGKEYVSWPVDPPDTLGDWAVQLVEDGDWYPAELVGGQVRLLLRGPAAPDDPAAVVLPESCRPRVRLIVGDEIVIRESLPLFLVPWI